MCLHRQTGVMWRVNTLQFIFFMNGDKDSDKNLNMICYILLIRIRLIKAMRGFLMVRI